MANHYRIIACFLLFSMNSFSQFIKKETLSSNGSSHFVYANNKSYFIQQSIGQASVTFTYSAGNYDLRQGFLQPVSPSALYGDATDPLKAVIFPNPFVDEINIRFGQEIYSQITITIYDVWGRLLFEQIYPPNHAIVVRVSHFSNGAYLMRVQVKEQALIAKLVKR